MGWPTEFWNPKTGSIETYKSPVATKPKGLPDDWKDHSAGSTPFWGIKGNPLWEVAAEANGMDFGMLTSRIDSELGTQEDWKDYEPETKTFTERERTLRNTWSTSDPITYNVEEYERAYDAWSNDEDSDRSNMPKKSDFTTGSGLNKYGFAEHDDLYSKLGQLDSWMTNSIKAFKDSDYNIIAKGPSGFDYGFDQEDLFEALGLNEAPQAPKALDVSYKMNLAQAKPSSASYSTPEGYTKVNLHG